jgi:hypothetical protein
MLVDCKPPFISGFRSNCHAVFGIIKTPQQKTAMMFFKRVMGFEPTDGNLGSYCLTTWRHPQANLLVLDRLPHLSCLILVLWATYDGSPPAFIILIFINMGRFQLGRCEICSWRKSENNETHVEFQVSETQHVSIRSIFEVFPLHYSV